MAGHSVRRSQLGTQVKDQTQVEDHMAAWIKAL